MAFSKEKAILFWLEMMLLNFVLLCENLCAT
jgi:hypothetical protein